jgi:hypothetical protein
MIKVWIVCWRNLKLRISCLSFITGSHWVISWRSTIILLLYELGLLGLIDISYELFVICKRTLFVPRSLLKEFIIELWYTIRVLLDHWLWHLCYLNLLSCCLTAIDRSFDMNLGFFLSHQWRGRLRLRHHLTSISYLFLKNVVNLEVLKIAFIILVRLKVILMELVLLILRQGLLLERLSLWLSIHFRFIN